MEFVTTNNSSEESLEALIGRETALPISGPADHWIKHFREVPGVAAVLFYGSGLWKSSEETEDVIFDFYLLVDRFREFDPKLGLAVAGTLVPPNVYYQEQMFEGKQLRCKFAVLTVDQFVAAAHGKSFTPHIWARFCQPCRIPYAADDNLRNNLIAAFAQSVFIFHRRTLHLINECSLSDFWSAGLASTYADELRSEKEGRMVQVFEASKISYETRTRLILEQFPEMGQINEVGIVSTSFPNSKKRLYRLGLSLKRPLSKAVIVARLIKAGFTFQGGLDYARWKVEKHSGVRIEITEFQRRHPVVGGLQLFVKVLRRGGLR